MQYLMRGSFDRRSASDTTAMSAPFFGSWVKSRAVTTFGPGGSSTHGLWSDSRDWWAASPIDPSDAFDRPGANWLICFNSTPSESATRHATMDLTSCEIAEDSTRAGRIVERQRLGDGEENGIRRRVRPREDRVVRDGWVGQGTV